jgi:hypothetical protein
MVEAHNKTILQVKKDERVHRYECDCNASLGELHDVMCEMLNFVINKINENRPLEKSVEEPKVENIG